ncbi:MAG TPA: hypothetical protein VHB02_04880 [Acidimicrobiales bacterium]|nr:hypothetical protein [Acidimicrobiales bacterium]
MSDAAAWGLFWVTLALATLTGGMMVATFLAVRAGHRTAKAAEKDIEQGQVLIEAAQAQAAASRDQAEAALALLEADRLPYLVPASASQDRPERQRRLFHGSELSTDVPRVPPKVGECWLERGGADQRGWMVLAVRNVGRGPALILRSPGDVVLKYPGGQQGAFGEPTSIVVAPGETEYVCFAVGATQLGEPHSLTTLITEGGGNYTNPTVRQTYVPELTVRFADISGRREWRARITYRFLREATASGWELEVTSAEVEAQGRTGF